MHKPPAKATRPDLLARIAGLGMSDSDVERAVPLPRGFISKARIGKNTGDRAKDSWIRLETWLAKKDGKAAPPPTADEDLSKLVVAIRAADTFEKVDEILVQLLEDVATGRVEPSKGRTLGDVLRERRQTMAAIAEEKARIDSDKPITVRVVFENGIYGAPACPMCMGTGRKPGG